MTWYDGEDQLMTMTGTSTNDGTQKIRERGLSAVQIDTQKKYRTSKGTKNKSLAEKNLMAIKLR